VIHLPERTEDTMHNFKQRNHSATQDFNRRPLEHEAGMLTIACWRLVMPGLLHQELLNKSVTKYIQLQ
jgi:hypothetical protein